MVSKSILAWLLGHPLSDCYWTTLKQYSPMHKLSSLGVRGCVGDPTSTKDEAFQQFINRCTPHLTSRFCKVELGLKSTFEMVSESILVRLLGLSGHPLSGRYQTILKQYNPTHELSSLGVKGCVVHQLEIRPFNSL